MSSPSDDQLTGESERRAQPSTQEIPVIAPTGATAAPLPPHPGAIPPAPAAPYPVAADEPQPTGPVDFVPGLPATPTVPPAAAAAPPPPPVQPVTTPGDGVVWPDTLESDLLSGSADRTKKTRQIRAPHDRAALLGLGLAVLALVLLELGLALDFGEESYWSAVPLWSAFATLCAGLAVAAFAASYPAGSKLRSGAGWRIAAGGLVGLAVFWVLVVLSVVATDRGFLLTAALGALGGALWVGPGRKA